MANKPEEKEFDTRAADMRKTRLIQQAKEVETLLEGAERTLSQDIINYYWDRTPNSEAEERRMQESVRKYATNAKRAIDRAARLIEELLR